MISYAAAKARAKRMNPDWNETTYIAKATITWFDEEWEYELEIENEDEMDDKEFTEWVEANAEAFAKEDAENNNTTFEGIDNIHYKEDYIDDDAKFDADYDAYLEFEWECATGR